MCGCSVLLTALLYQLLRGPANIDDAGPEGCLRLDFGPKSIYSLVRGGTSMIGLKSRGTVMICLLFVVISFPLSADSNVPTDAIEADPILTDEFNSCPDLPVDAISVHYRILATIGGNRDGRGPGLMVPEEETNPGIVALFDRQLIDGEVQYQEIYGAASAGVDWASSRVLIVEEFASYKFGEIDSDIRLSGVYMSGNSIIVSQTSTHYGPCQGIAQDPSWFSFDITYLLLVLPRRPEHIAYHFCRIGDCPPDIP